MLYKIFISKIVTNFFLQKRFSSVNEFDTLSKVHGELDELKDIMVRNIGKKNKSELYIILIITINYYYFQTV